MDWRRLTKRFILAVGYLIAVWDLAALIGGGVPGTISRVILDWSHDWPVVPFLFGVLAGHLFWPQKKV